MEEQDRLREQTEREDVERRHKKKKKKEGGRTRKEG